MNWTGKIAQIFVKNGRLSLLLIIALFSWGIMSFIITPKQYNPKITAPAFQIFVDYPGASKTEVLEQVTKPLENIISDIPGVEDIFSVTKNGGQSNVTVNFTVGENVDSAKITLNDRIQSNFDRVPLGISQPLIKSIDPDDVPVLTIALTSNEIDQINLRKFSFKLRDRLRTIEGASNIEVVGCRKRELGILIDPIKIKKIGIGISAIEQALERSNLYLPAGKIKNPNKYIPLESTSIVQKPKDLKDIVVATGDYGQVHLSELATIKEKQEEVEEYIRHIKKDKDKIIETKSVVLLSIAKLAGTNISDVTDRIKNNLTQLKKNYIPGNISAEVIVNEGQTASNEINGLISNLFTSVFIVVIVLLLFLDFRAALLVAISIPLTLACVFGVGLIAGKNINRITLFALILSLGLLVDSATVVIENIVRKLSDKSKKGKSDKKESVVMAVNEVGVGLFMSTITTVLAFIPMAFVTGMMGPYMGPIPFFLPTALIVSFLLALTINPWMASVVLRKRNKKTKRTFSIPAVVNKKFQSGKIILKNIYEKYHGYLHTLLINSFKRKIFLTIVGLLIIISFMLPAIALVKFRMLPKADREQFFIYLDLPLGTPLEKTLLVSQKFEKYLLQDKDIIMTQSFIGHPPIIDFNGLFRGVASRNQSHQATIRVGLTNSENRKLKSEELVLNKRPGLIKLANQISPGIKLKLVEDPPGPPVLSTFLVRVQGYNEKILREVAKDLLPKVKEIDEVVDVDSSIEDEQKTIQLKVKPVRASRSRISPARIVEVLNTLYAGKVLGVYHNKDNIEQEKIVLRLKRKFRKNKKSINDIYLYNDLGIEVALKDLVEVETIPTVRSVRRENRISTVYLYGDMGNRSVTYAAIDFLKLLAGYELPGIKSEILDLSLFGASYMLANGEKVTITVGGEWELTLEVFRDLGLAMAIAIFMIYFVLVAQFGSFREPIIIMATIPLSLIGILPGFMVLGFFTGLYFSATSMIGVIALAGIAVNNSIILLEYLNSLKGKGYKLEKALLEAARIRFRPIMLTTITTMLGSLTIASDPVWAGLAYAIILGLGISSILTLLVFPVMYYILRGKTWYTS